MTNQDPSQEELWWAQQVQQAYIKRMQALRPNFASSLREYNDPAKWLSPARAARDAKLSPDRLVAMVFAIEPAPVPWKFIRAAGKLKYGDIKAPEEGMTMDEELKYRLKWSLQRFGDIASPSDPEYGDIVASTPEAINVPSWLRVLIGFQHPQVLHVHLNAAIEFFRTRPDIVEAAIRLGFPPSLFEFSDQ